MAFSNRRIRALEGGQQGFGITLIYDGRGTGGDDLATITHSSNFFFPNRGGDRATVDTFKRAIEAVPGTGTGAGRMVPVLVLANNDWAIHPFWVDGAAGDQIKVGGAAFSIS